MAKIQKKLAAAFYNELYIAYAYRQLLNGYS